MGEGEFSRQREKHVQQDLRQEQAGTFPGGMSPEEAQWEKKMRIIQSTVHLKEGFAPDLRAMGNS